MSIVAALRATAPHVPQCALLMQAADEIDRLAAIVERLKIDEIKAESGNYSDAVVAIALRLAIKRALLEGRGG